MLTIILMFAMMGEQTPREWNERGLSHEDRQEWTQAESAFRKALKQAPTADETLTITSNLAFLLLRQGRSGEAKRLAPVLESALANATAGPDVARALGCIGAIHWRTGKASEGVSWLRRSLDAWTDAGLPNEAFTVKNNLAAALYDAGQIAEAEEVLQQISETEGLEHPTVLANMAVIHANGGRFDRAVTAFAAALECPYHSRLDARQQAEIRVRYAAVLRKLGRKDQAKRQQNEANSLWRAADAFTRHRVDWRDLSPSR